MEGILWVSSSTQMTHLLSLSLGSPCGSGSCPSHGCFSCCPGPDLAASGSGEESRRGRGGAGWAENDCAYHRHLTESEKWLFSGINKRGACNGNAITGWGSAKPGVTFFVLYCNGPDQTVLPSKDVCFISLISCHPTPFGTVRNSSEMKSWKDVGALGPLVGACARKHTCSWFSRVPSNTLL